MDHAHTATQGLPLRSTTKLESRFILGLCDVYGRFVDNFAPNAGLLRTALQKTQRRALRPRSNNKKLFEIYLILPFLCRP